MIMRVPGPTWERLPKRPPIDLVLAMGKGLVGRTRSSSQLRARTCLIAAADLDSPSFIGASSQQQLEGRRKIAAATPAKTKGVQKKVCGLPPFA